MFHKFPLTAFKKNGSTNLLKVMFLRIYFYFQNSSYKSFGGCGVVAYRCKTRKFNEIIQFWISKPLDNFLKNLNLQSGDLEKASLFRENH